MTAPLAEAGGQNGKTATETIIMVKDVLCHIAVTQHVSFHYN